MDFQGRDGEGFSYCSENPNNISSEVLNEGETDSGSPGSSQTRPRKSSLSQNSGYPAIIQMDARDSTGNTVYYYTEHQTKKQSRF
jgi:hypothetical protein